MYFKLSKIHREDKKEQYRVNLICSVIYGMILHQGYLQLRPSEVHSTIADRILKEAGWLTKHHLKIKDFTREKNIGDCLFENVAGQLPEGISVSEELRQKVVLFMKENSQNYQPFFAAELAPLVTSLADNSSSSSSSGALNSSSTGTNLETMQEPANSHFRDTKLLVGDGDDEKSLTFEDWADYLDKMGKPQVWATTLEIRALADMSIDRLFSCNLKQSILFTMKPPMVKRSSYTISMITILNLVFPSKARGPKIFLQGSRTK